ncbi:MAG: ABC transporter ATP-binding protein, partial [Clostridia bacterium]
SFDIEPQKDIRLYNLIPMYKNTVVDYNEIICEWFGKFMKRQGIAEGAQAVITVFQSAVVYAYVGIRTVSDVIGKVISLGDFTMYTSSAISFTSSVMNLGKNAVSLFQILALLTPLAEFLTLPDSDNNKGKKKVGDIEKVEFRNISFKYPNSDKIVLDNITFSVEKGEKISIVGLNGAGKTTLIKLLSRLYEPTNGNIFVNGIDIREYDYNDYISKFAAVFQDFKLIDYTLVENVNCDKVDINRDKVYSLLTQVGMKDKLDSLPNGIDTMLGKSYDKDGIEVSGGQAQKIATARALYKNAPFIILDEPTSALDPLAEAEIYENFNALVGDKTAFYISHRMSSSKFCDKILIIDGGKVADFDTHANLMKKQDSLYYKLFNAQAVNYQS